MSNMEGNIQVISREMIKPSSDQTPPHPKKVKLSYIDKFLNHLHFPLMFFYEADESRGLTTSNHLQITQRLKQSLVDTLSPFYPLAGRLKNNRYVHCNDAGAELVVARANGAHIKDSIFMDDQLRHYYPSEYTTSDSGSRRRAQPLLVAQITFFDCGGLVVAASLSHSITDLASAMEFLHAWAAAFRGEEAKISKRSFGTAAYFPSLNFIPFSRFQRKFISDKNFMTKRFVFDKEKLEILREAAISPSESGLKDPRHVELVSAFIWKHFTAARLQNGKCRKMYAALHMVNLRPRTSPPHLLQNIFGNCVMFAMAFAARCGSAKDLHLHELVGRLRRSIQRVRGGYITKALSKESFVKDLFKLGFLLVVGRVEWCFFTSWRGFPTYELDFGWGKPVWFTTPSAPSKNLIVLMSNKSGDALEAIVHMMPHDLQILDEQIKLLSTNV